MIRIIMLILLRFAMSVCVSNHVFNAGMLDQTYALFMVTFNAYAEPKTDWCHSEVRMLSMTEVGPRDTAMA